MIRVSANIVVSFLIVHSLEHHTVGLFIDVVSWCISALQRSASSSSFPEIAYLINFDCTWGALVDLLDTRISRLISHLASFIIHQFSSTFIILSESTGSATNASVSGITEIPLPNDLLAPISPLHIATPTHISPLAPSCHIARTYISARRQKMAAMEPNYTIGQPDVQYAPSTSDLFATWVRYPHINVTYE